MLHVKTPHRRPGVLPVGTHARRSKDHRGSPFLKVGHNSACEDLALDRAQSLDEFVAQACQQLGVTTDPSEMVIVDEKRVVVDLDSYQEVYVPGLHDMSLPHYLVPRARANEPLTEPMGDITRALPHPAALTQAGKRSFANPAEAVFEFTDNGLGATKCLNVQPDIVVDLHEQNGRCLSVMDNGCGMLRAKLKEYATYAASREARGYHDSANTTDGSSLSQNINKFGVGAKDAGFFLGSRITVLSKCSDSPDFQQLVMCEEEMFKKYEVDQLSGDYYDFPITTIPPDLVVESVLKGLHLKLSSNSLQSTIDSFSQRSQGTLIIITGLRDHTIEWSQKMVKVDAQAPHVVKVPEVAFALADTYHYYLHDQDLPEWMSRDDKDSSGESKRTLQLTLRWQPKQEPRIDLDLAQLLSRTKRCLKNEIEPFEYKIRFETTSEKVCGEAFVSIRFHPISPEGETNPELEEDNDPKVRVFWGGRGVPRTTCSVKALPLLEKRSRKRDTVDKLPDEVLKNRMSAHIFFPHCVPIANNKTRLNIDSFPEWLHQQSPLMLAGSTTREASVDPHCRKWLTKCHQEHDREMTFSDPSGGVYYSVKYGTKQEQKTLRCGDKFTLQRGAVKRVLGEVLHFTKGASPEMHYQEYPTAMHSKPGSIPMARLVAGVHVAKFEQLTPEKWDIECLKANQKLPHSVSVEPPITQFEAGHVIHEMVIRVLDGNNSDMSAMKQRKLSMRVYTIHGDKEEQSGNDMSLSWIESKGGFLATKLELNQAVKHRYEFRLEGAGPQFSGGPQKHVITVTPAQVSECVLRVDARPAVWTQGIRLGEKLPSFEMLLYDQYGNNRDARGWLEVTAETTDPHVHVVLPKSKYRTNKDEASVLIEDAKLQYTGPAESTVLPSSIQITFLIRDDSRSLICKYDISDEAFKVYDDLENLTMSSLTLPVLPGKPHKLLLVSDPIASVHATQKIPSIRVGLRDCHGLPTCPLAHEKWSLQVESPFIRRTQKFTSDTGTFVVDGVQLNDQDVNTSTDIRLFLKLCDRANQFVPVDFEVPIQIQPTGHPTDLRLASGTDIIQSGAKRSLEAGSLHDLRMTLHRVFEVDGKRYDHELPLSDFKIRHVVLSKSGWWNGQPEVDNDDNHTGTLAPLQIPTVVSGFTKHKVTLKLESNATRQELTLCCMFAVRPVPATATQLLAFHNATQISQFQVNVGSQGQLSQICVHAADQYGNLVPSGDHQLQGTLADHPGLILIHPQLGPAGYLPETRIIAKLGPKGRDTVDATFSCSGLKPVTVEIVMVPGEVAELRIHGGSLALPLKCRGIVAGLKVALLDCAENSTVGEAAIKLAFTSPSRGTVIVSTGSASEGIWSVPPWKLESEPGETVCLTAHPATANSHVARSKEYSMQLISLNRVVALEIESPTTTSMRAGASPPVIVGHFCMDDPEPGKPWEANLERSMRVICSQPIEYTVQHARLGPTRYAFQCTPAQGAVISSNGRVSFTVEYTELRPDVVRVLEHDERQVRAEPIFVEVECGPATQVATRQIASIPIAYGHDNTDSRMLSSHELYVHDDFGNLVQSCNTMLTSTVIPDGFAPADIPVIAWSGNEVVNGRAFVSVVLKHGTGEAGKYLLQIAALGLRPAILPFNLVTDMAQQRELERRQDRIAELEQIIDPLRADLAVKMHELENMQHTLEQRKIDSDLSRITSEQDAIEGITHTQHRLDNIIASEPRAPKTPCGPPPPSPRLVELAFVDDAGLASLLSWFLGPRVGALFCRTTEELQAALAVGYAGLCEQMLGPLSEDHKFLLEVPGVEARLLWSCLTYKSTLSAQLFASLFGSAVMVSSVDEAISYRTKMVSLGKTCKILVSESNCSRNPDEKNTCSVLDQDGFIDPHHGYHQPDFVFGGVPHMLQPAVQKLKSNLRKLQDILEAIQKRDAAQKSVDAAHDSLAEQRRAREELEELKKLQDTSKRALGAEVAGATYKRTRR